MLLADCPLVRPKKPSLEQGGDSVRSRKQDMSGLAASSDDSPFVDVVEFLQAVVALPSIGDDGATRCNHILHERLQGLARCIWYLAKSNTTEA